MYNNLFLKIVISFFLLFPVNISFAIDSLHHKSIQVVLVQLRSEQNRIAALTKNRQYALLEEAKTDAQKCAAAMINDFTDHFKYCPVYYYMDTNVEAVKSKQFDGILLNADGSKAKNIPINKNSSGYIIVYYGYPNYQDKKDDVASDELSRSAGRGLIILNDQYKQIAYSFLLAYNEGSNKR